MNARAAPVPPAVARDVSPALRNSRQSAKFLVVVVVVAVVVVLLLLLLLAADFFAVPPCSPRTSKVSVPYLHVDGIFGD